MHSSPRFFKNVVSILCSLSLVGCYTSDFFSDVGPVDSLAALADFPIGVAVSPSGAPSIFDSSARQQLVRQHFQQISAENHMKMSFMYSGGGFDFANADALVQWAHTNGMTVHGHALVWHSDYQLPYWARESTDTFVADFDRHITTVAAHFAAYDNVVSWDVVNEALHEVSADGYRRSVFFRQFGGPSYISRAFTLARAAAPNVDLYYNDYNIENNGRKTDALITMLTSLLNDGVPIDGVGFQMHVGNFYPSLAAIRQSIRRVVQLDPSLKVKITELDVSVNNPLLGVIAPSYKDRDACIPWCRGLDIQAQRYHDIVRIYLEEVPPERRGGITVWGIADQDSWLSSHLNQPEWPLLFNDYFEQKPALWGFAAALKTYQSANKQ